MGQALHCLACLAKATGSRMFLLDLANLLYVLLLDFIILKPLKSSE